MLSFFFLFFSFFSLSFLFRKLYFQGTVKVVGCCRYNEAAIPLDLIPIIMNCEAVPPDTARPN